MTTESTPTKGYQRQRLQMRFHVGYCVVAVIIFIVEILIALFLRDPFIRPYGGDFLVVILLYAMLRAFTNTPVLKAAIAVFAFACLIETAQYFDIVLLLHLEENDVARTVIGQSFEWMDIVTYAAGLMVVLIVERWRRQW